MKFQKLQGQITRIFDKVEEKLKPMEEQMVDFASLIETNQASLEQALDRRIAE